MIQLSGPYAVMLSMPGIVACRPSIFDVPAKMPFGIVQLVAVAGSSTFCFSHFSSWPPVRLACRSSRAPGSSALLHIVIAYEFSPSTCMCMPVMWYPRARSTAGQDRPIASVISPCVRSASLGMKSAACETWNCIDAGMPSPVIRCSPARRAPLGTCLPCFGFGQYTQPGLRSMSRSTARISLEMLPVAWKSMPCIAPIGLSGSTVLPFPFSLNVATLGWPGRTLAPQPQYSVIFTWMSGTLPGAIVPLPSSRGPIGVNASDLPSFRPAGTSSCASTPGFRLLCSAMSRYCPVMPPARVVG